MMRKHVALLLILFPVCAHLLDVTFYNDPYKTTWTGALTHCRKYHTDLVQIRTAEDNDALEYTGWIGLFKDNAAGPWKWSRGGEQLSFKSWGGGGEPHMEHDCVTTDSNGKWHTQDCGSNQGFSCYDEPLILVKENKTWEEALEYCRSRGPASSYWKHHYDLVTLITSDNYTTAREIARAATTDEVWTGLCYLAGEWLWVSGEQVQYQDLPKCPTQGSCGVLKKSGTAPYGIRHCQEKRNFLCYKYH